MSLFDYRFSRALDDLDVPFHGLLMAAIRKADTENFQKFRACWPQIVAELEARYNVPGGLLPGESVELTAEGLKRAPGVAQGEIATVTKPHPHYPDRFPGGGTMKCLSCGMAITLHPLAEHCPGPEILPLRGIGS
jgi:hypothetical protein